MPLFKAFLRRLRFLGVGLALIQPIYGEAETRANRVDPIVELDQVFEAIDGTLIVEAEHFYKQSRTLPRRWYITMPTAVPTVERDVDEPHLLGASGDAYVEALPDSRQNHDETLVKGENFSDTPGAMATLHYKINFKTPGRYYIWIRAYSSNSEDDSVHVGLDGVWPETGMRWRTTINDRWGWQCKRRFPPGMEETGEPLLCYIDIEKTGERDLQISMREDGAELDKILLTLDESYVPLGIGQ